jgi:hypothetical protein
MSTRALRHVAAPAKGNGRISAPNHLRQMWELRQGFSRMLKVDFKSRLISIEHAGQKAAALKRLVVSIDLAVEPEAVNRSLE